MVQSSILGRRSIRYKGYDYSLGGAYFVTLVTQHRRCLFGNIRNGKMYPNDLGLILQEIWWDIPNHFPQAALDEFILMPNHLHGIILITQSKDGTECSGQCPASDRRVSNPPTFGKPAPHSLATIMRSFKSGVTKRINEKWGTPGTGIWQRNYFDRVIRNEKELARIREYIFNNPLQWETDQENPMAKTVDPKIIPEPWEIENESPDM